MKVSRLETYSTPDVGLVRLTTDSGDEGWGQLSTYNADISAQVFHRQVAPHAVGRDVGDLEVILDEIVEIEFKFPGSYLRRALAGLDTAIWDLRGKLAGVSVCELLGGQPRLYPVYASSMRRDIEPEAEATRLARLQQADGYRAAKFRIGSENGHDRDERPGRTEAIVPAVAGALDPATKLMVDANCGYSSARAIEVGVFLDDAGVTHFEEPCPYWQYEETAAVRQALDARSIQVAGGEQDCDLATWRRMVDTPVFDVVQPDILYVGGLVRAMRVAAMAAEAGLPCLPHSANLSLVTVFTLHMMGAIPNAAGMVEWSIEGEDYYPWQSGIYDPELTVRDGMVDIPNAPGWGVEIRPEWLAGAERTVTALSG